MNIKVLLACGVIVAAIGFGAVSFMETNVEYGDFHQAVEVARKVQIKGVWVQDRETSFDPQTNLFSFYMVDDNGRTEHILFEGAKPNNFEIADAIVVKGTWSAGAFHADEILTKCPSKYEGDTEAVERTL
jgi:cytochrome c-type biogenesis protein CcmE